MKITMTIEFEIDEDLWYDDEVGEIWFKEEVMEESNLGLYSKEADDIAYRNIKVKEITYV